MHPRRRVARSVGTRSRARQALLRSFEAAEAWALLESFASGKAFGLRGVSRVASRGGNSLSASSAHSERSPTRVGSLHSETIQAWNVRVRAIPQRFRRTADTVGARSTVRRRTIARATRFARLATPSKPRPVWPPCKVGQNPTTGMASDDPRCAALQHSCDEIAHGLDPRIAGVLMPLAQFNRGSGHSFASRVVEEVVTVGKSRNRFRVTAALLNRALGIGQMMQCRTSRSV